LAVPKGPSWPIFLKFDGDKVVVHINQSAGWCYDLPVFSVETLEHIRVAKVTTDEVELSFDGKSKTIKLDVNEAGHYYGRYPANFRCG